MPAYSLEAAANRLLRAPGNLEVILLTLLETYRAGLEDGYRASEVGLDNSLTSP